MIEKQLDNLAIHYWTNATDTKNCIVLLHPAFTDHTCFDEQIEFFQADYKLIVPDLIGHGASLGKGSITDTADEIVAMMTAEKIDKINLVGVSIGAVLAADFANKYPEKLASLYCVGGYDINNFDASHQKNIGGQQMKMLLIGLVSIKRFAAASKKLAAYTAEAQEKFYQMSLSFKKSSFRYLANLGSLVNKYKTATRRYPMVIAVGEHDNDIAKVAARQWADNEPDAKYVVFLEAGHIVNLDTPDKFNQELLTIVG